MMKSIKGIKRAVAFVLIMLMSASASFASEISADYSEKTQNFIIEGKTAAEDAGKTVSVLLTKKDDGKIGHIGMTEVGEDGRYIYKFKLESSPSDYELKLRIDGRDITGTLINEIKSFTNSVVMTVNIKNEEGKPFKLGADTTADFKAVLDNKFEDGTQVSVFAAFYKADGLYLGGEVVYDGALKYGDFAVNIGETLEIPDGTAEIKLISFAGLKGLKPLNEAKSIKGDFGMEFFISPDGQTGDDAKGTEEEPFSLKGAIHKIYRLKQQNKLPDGGIVFYLKGGDYDFSSAEAPSEDNPFNGELAFSEATGGTKECPITFKAVKGEKPVFTGGKKFDKSEFSPLSENDAMYNKIPEESRSKILTLNLTDNGISDFGTYAETGSSNSDGIGDLRIELFADDEPCELAMWPNKTNDGYVYTHSTDVIVNANADNESEKATKPVLKVEQAAANKLKEWDLNSDKIFCEGWFGYKYFCDSVLVDGFDAESNSLTLSKSVRGGFYDAGRSVWHENSYVKDKNEFRFYNVIEELDSEGEYYIDRNAGVLYFYAPENFKEAGLTLAKNKFISLFDGADYISFEGISFELGRRGYVNIEKSENISFKDCEFKNSSYEGMLIGTTYKYNKLQYGDFNDEDFLVKAKDIAIENCVFKNLGKGGVLAAGGSLRTLERANLTVKNCLFDSCDRIIKNYAPAISFMGVGADITGCTIKNQNGQGMEIGGADINIAYNEFENVTAEAHDTGIIYSQKFSYGVDIMNNYFHDTRWDFNNEYDFCITSPTGKTVQNNPAVYIDGYQIGGNVQNNIFENVPVGCVMRSYGHKVQNNIFVDVPVALHTSQNNDVYSTVEEKNLDLYDAKTVSPLKTIFENEALKKIWNAKYPELASIKEKLDNRSKDNKKYPIISFEKNLLAYNELEDFGELGADKLIIGYDNAISGGNSFNNLIITSDCSVFANLNGGDFSLYRSSEIMNKAPDLIKIQKSKMGRK